MTLSSHRTGALLLGIGLLLAAYPPVGCDGGGIGGFGGATTTTITTTLSTGGSTGSGGGTTSSTSSVGGGGGGGTTTSSGSGGAGGKPGCFLEPAAWTDCHACLEVDCAAEKAACGPDCIAVQACLDAVCANLSAIASPEEGACQVHCQKLHMAGKAKHLALVNCAQGTSCEQPVSPECWPPCVGYSYDYDECTADAEANACNDVLLACLNDDACLMYEACMSTCTTLMACLACASTPEGAAGRDLYEVYKACVEERCIVEGWLPNF